MGGNIINNPLKLKQFLARFSLKSGRKILVHGGGNIASETCIKMGIEPEMVDGRRITNRDALDVMTMVYGGLINKDIVAQLQQLGCNALGLSGADGNSIEAKIRPKYPIDFGWVGDISHINTELINHLLNAQITPVFCAISHDVQGQLLNTNADNVASAIAIALCEQYETELLYTFDRAGVLTDTRDAKSAQKSLSQSDYKSLRVHGKIQGGMLPKLETAFHALENGVNQVSIGKTLLTN